MLEYVQDGCFSFQFYIKPQQTAFSVRFQHGCFSFQFYIKPQHHRRCRCSAEGCFSFQFYIKPQHLARGSSIRIVVSHSNSTSNHNIWAVRETMCLVVSHSNSTSNHNGHANEYIFAVLFLIPILHQTTTMLHSWLEELQLFLIPILHQTTTQSSLYVRHAMLFLIPILHQTTTVPNQFPCLQGCFSFQFYIKPQHRH